MRNAYFINMLLLTAALIFPALSCEEPISINDFQAVPSTITEGQASTLQWSTSGVTRANLNNGIGDVIASGTAIVTPSITTKYVLTIVKDKQKLTREVTVTVNKETFNTAPQVPASSQQGASQESKAKWTPAALKYDYMKGPGDDYLSNQVAVWHTYAKLAGSSSAASSFYSNSTRGGMSSLGSAGVAVKSPLIILPGDMGMVCIIRNYSQVSYRWFDLVATWYGDSKDDASHLEQAGYGLAMSFSPEKKPYKIQKINMAAVANHSGDAGEYELFHCIVRVLDNHNKVIWSKSLPWSYFKSGTASGIPPAAWKSIAVDDVIVNGDFVVEVLAESNEYECGRDKSNHYLAIAYEKLADKDANARGFISDNGGGADSWIRLYDAYGHPISFNLCIRVEGSYQE